MLVGRCYSWAKLPESEPTQVTRGSRLGSARDRQPFFEFCLGWSGIQYSQTGEDRAVWVEALSAVKQILQRLLNVNSKDKPDSNPNPHSISMGRNSKEHISAPKGS